MMKQYKAHFQYGATESTYEGTLDYVLGIVQIHSAYQKTAREHLARYGKYEWGWWTIERQ